MELVLLDNELEEVGDTPMEGHIVYGGIAPLNIGGRLWNLMWEEFRRNGKKTLTRGKVRFLRRRVRKSRLSRRLQADMDTLHLPGGEGRGLYRQISVEEACIDEVYGMRVFGGEG